MGSQGRSRSLPSARCWTSIYPRPKPAHWQRRSRLLADGDIPGALALYRSAWEESGQKLEMTRVRRCVGERQPTG